jgi:hypothetical protein
MEMLNCSGAEVLRQCRGAEVQIWRMETMQKC